MSEELDNIIDLDDEANIIELEDEDGNKIQFEFLDYITYNEKEYIVLLPIEEETNDVIVLGVEPIDEELENYVPVENDETVVAVFELFKERNADLYDFE